MGKRQEGGDKSVNVQADAVVIHHGLQPDDVVLILRESIPALIQEFSGEAKRTSEKRVEDFTTKLVDEWACESPDTLTAAKDPDFQWAFSDAAKAFSRTGDVDAGELLIDLLVARSRLQSRTLHQVVMNEALTVVPRITDDQIAALAASFLLGKAANTGVATVEDLQDYVRSVIVPLIGRLPDTDSPYLHLQYLGCVGIGPMPATALEGLFAKAYPKLLALPLDETDLIIDGQSLTTLNDFVMPAVHDPTKWQVTSPLGRDLEDALEEASLSEKVKAHLKSLHGRHLANEQIVSLLDAAHNTVPTLRGLWSDTLLGRLNLTSVGIAIGLSEMRRLTGSDFELGLWIEEPTRRLL